MNSLGIIFSISLALILFSQQMSFGKWQNVKKSPKNIDDKSDILGKINLNWNKAIPQAILIAVLAVVSFDIIMKTTAVWLWNALYEKEGWIFFFGIQVSMVMFIFALNMNKDVKSKPINPAFPIAILIIVMTGLIGPFTIPYDSDSSPRKTSYQEKPVDDVVVNLHLLPGKWTKFHLSTRYRNITISPDRDVKVMMPSGKIIVTRRIGMVERDDFSYGEYRFTPKGRMEANVKIKLRLS